jgi:nucleotide-binding universal stress UspA family protein
MKEITDIMVPVDFSDCSGQAFDYAIMLASRLQAKLSVLHVWEIPRYMRSSILAQAGDESRESVRDAAERQAGAELQGFLKQHPLPVGLEVDSVLRCGDVSGAILQAVKEGGHDLVVIGTQGRTGLSHFLLGSIAEKVVRAAACPVLTIRSTQSTESTEGKA